MKIDFGWSAPHIEIQLNEQGLKFIAREYENKGFYEDCRRAITKFHIHGYITDTEHKNIVKRFMKDLKGVVEKNNEVHL